MYSDFFLEFYLNLKSCVNKSSYRTVNFLLSLKTQTTQSVACQQPRNTSSAAVTLLNIVCCSFTRAHAGLKNCNKVQS